MRTCLILPILLALLAFPAAGHAASFDCGRASTPEERAVCGDPQLSELDSAMGTAYAQAKRQATGEDQAAVQATARGVLADRHACNLARPCMMAVYAGGIAAYWRFGSTEQIPSWVTAVDLAGGSPPKGSALPQRVAQCASTRVSAFGPRLSGTPPGDFSAGTGVSFANGGTQVSYEAVRPVIASRPGDEVVMCLISIPRACPPGDDRGRIYTVTNLRTKGTWTLPDAQHMCGGA